MKKRVVDLASEQRGLVSRGQLRGLGLKKGAIDWLVAKGELEVRHPGVYMIPGSEWTFERHLQAAVLAAGGRAFVSHRAAAFLYKIPIPAAPTEISVLRGKNPRIAGVDVWHPSRLPEDHVTDLDGLPITTPARTIVDLAGVLKTVPLAVAFDGGLGKRLYSCDSVRAVLAALPRHKGEREIRRLLAERPTGAVRVQSVLESRFHELLRAEGIDGWVPQFEVKRANGKCAFIDVAFPVEMVAFEIDGFQHHAVRTGWDKDQDRRADIVSLGWRVIPITKKLLDDLPALTALVHRAIGR